MNDIRTMDDIRFIMENYKEVRDRLRRSPHATSDSGINLRGKKNQTVPLFQERIVSAPVPPEPPPEPPSYKPFGRTDLTFSSTLQFAAKEFHITGKQIRSRNRTQEISLPRQVAIWLAAKNRLQSLAGMGRYLKMDHTTMIHAKNRITSLMASDDILRDRILTLESKILAAFNRTSVPAKHEPHLEGQENGRGVPRPSIYPVDKTGGPNLSDPETDSPKPDVVR